MNRCLIALLVALPGLAQADAAASVVSPAGSLVQVIVGLTVVLGFIVTLAWLARRLGVAQTGRSGAIQIVGAASVGTRERVVVVEVAGQWLVVGVGAGQVSALATLPRGELPTDPPVQLPPFAARLKQLIENRRGQN